jgi:hypothetical protein
LAEDEALKKELTRQLAEGEKRVVHEPLDLALLMRNVPEKPGM